MPRPLQLGLFVGAAWSFSCLLCGCRSATPPEPIPLTAPEGQSRAAAPEEQSEDKALLVAIAPVVSPQETLSAYEALVAHLGRRLHRPTRILQRATYAETNQLIREGLCDLAFVCSLAYVRGNEEFGMEPVVVPQIRGKTTYQSYVIVRADSPHRTLEDLRGKSFAFVDPLSNTGWLSPMYLLKQQGDTSESFFSKTVFSRSHDNSIHLVAEGVVEGAAIDSLVYHNLEEKRSGVKGTRIIRRSEPYGIPPVVVPPGIDLGLKAELRETLLTMHEDPAGRKLLAELMIDRFVPRSETSYESIRRMDDALERGR